MARREGLLIPEGNFGSDVEGTKPIFFDVGKDERKMEEALDHCRKHLGDNVTILYYYYQPDKRYNSEIRGAAKMAKDQGKKEGGPWDCYDAQDFYGWEAERVVVVAAGGGILEQATRARTKLILILAKPEDDSKKLYARLQENIKAAADVGLVDVEKGGDDWA